MSERRFMHRGEELVVVTSRDGDAVSLERPDAEPLRCETRHVGGSEFVLRDPDDPCRMHAVHALRDGSHWWIHFDGRTYHLEAIIERGGGATAPGGLTAPTPASVTEVLVSDGDAVEAGQVLLVLSAMKMQIEIKSPLAGTVKGLKLAPGDQVDGGMQLLSVEPVED